MSIDEFIEKIESDYLEKALKDLGSKELCMVYLSAKEYQRAKLIRTNAIPEDKEDEKSISVTIKKGI